MVYIDRQVKYRSIINITSKNEEAFFKGLDKILWKYNSAGFTITIIHADYEFKPLIDKVKDKLDVTMNYDNWVDHVPEIWQNIRIVKEGNHSQYHIFIFKNIPKVMIRYLAF